LFCRDGNQINRSGGAEINWHPPPPDPGAGPFGCMFLPGRAFQRAPFPWSDETVPLLFRHTKKKKVKVIRRAITGPCRTGPGQRPPFFF